MSLNWFSMELLSTVFAFSLISVGCLAQPLDPCRSARLFPYQEIRDPKNKISPNDKALTDRYIREGWYGDFGLDMPTESPGLFHCGTRFPIYLNDNLPNTNDVTNVSVCVDTISNKCYPTFRIEVKKCKYFYIYHLTRLPLSESAYCVGNVNQDGDPPKFSTDANVTFNTETTNVVSLVFYCDFDLSTEEKLWYIVSWYTDDVLVYLTQPVHHNETKETISHKTRLTEETLMDEGVKSVGFHIKCSVRASYTQTSATSLQSISEGRLVGIEILTQAIDIKEGEEKEIEIRPTAPIGCLINEGVLIGSSLYVNINYPPPTDDTCTVRAYFTDCRISINSSDWNKVYKIPVYVKTAPVYGNDITEYFVQLKTVDIYPAHTIWQNVDIGDVKLRIQKDTQSIESKWCKSTGDPHMKTFEKGKYDIQDLGTYTLYENKEWQQEVQMETYRCGGTVYCNCGVGVRAGREVFIIDNCNRSNWFINYGLCDEPSNLLDVKRRGTNYRIGLPSGTIVVVNIVLTYLNIFVYPSAADINTARGLCGNVKKMGDSSDGFIKREGHSGKFYQSWSVPFFGSVEHTLNLFEDTDRNFLDRRNIGSSYCSCDINEENKNKINCTTGCKTIIDYHPIRECKIKTSSRRKRSVLRKQYVVQIDSNLHHVYRREADKTKWSEMEARDYCKSAMDNSSAVQVCKHLPNIDIESPLNDCVFDLKASGDTGFAIMSVETIKSQCFREVSANVTLQEAEKGQQSIFEQVKMVACPNECTKQGNCINGSCDCNEHFVGYDCSVDIRLPLLLDEVSDEGLCDLADDDCTEISVLGGTFVELNTSSCKIQPVEFSEEGLGKELNYTLQTSYVESIGEVICTFPKQRQRRSLKGPEMEFVKLYKVSVSNNGEVFSNETYLVVYNSGCQTCTLEDGDVQCAYKEDYCMSGGVCYQKGEPHAVDKCYLCSVTGSSRSWQYSSSPECSKASTGEEEEKGWPIWVIAVVTCVVVVFSVLLIGFCCIAYRKYRIFKTVFGNKQDIDLDAQPTSL